jgi:aldehyde:ferredoxin oxidoreductase
VELFKLAHCQAILADSMAVCLFVPYSFQMDADVLTAVTGWDTGIAELVRVGERILTLTRLFNIREGFTVADDEMPKRFYQPKTDGVLADISLDPAEFARARSYYYALMGWDANGVPLPERVEGLYIE